MTTEVCLWNHSFLSPFRLSHALISWSAPCSSLKQLAVGRSASLGEGWRVPKGACYSSPRCQTDRRACFYVCSPRDQVHKAVLHFFLLPHHLRIRKSIQHLEPRGVQETSSLFLPPFLFTKPEREDSSSAKSILYSL